MKLNFSKTGRIADTEIIISCSCPASSMKASFEINDLVKEAALDLAREVKEMAVKIKQRELSGLGEKPPAIQTLRDELINEPQMRKRKS